MTKRLTAAAVVVVMGLLANTAATAGPRPAETLPVADGQAAVASAPAEASGRKAVASARAAASGATASTVAPAVSEYRAAPGDGAPGKAKAPDFPGSAPWQQVPRNKVVKECGLEPALLESVEPTLGQTPYVIVRYGKLCWAGGDAAQRAETYGVMSVTKTLAALLFGIVAARTDVNELTRVSDWVPPGEQSNDVPATLLAQRPANPDARVFHLLTMTEHNPSLAYGTRLPWMYESTGQNGLNSLIRLIDNVVEAHPAAFPGSTSARELAINELFKPLGMTSTNWDGNLAAFGMNSSVYDLARLGELMLRKGRWGDEQIVDEDFIYRMTHPQVEDIQTHYGYLTWLNAAAGQALDNGDTSDLACSPFAGWRQYPHAPTFDAPDDRGGAPFRDGHDVGVFWAQGLGGQHVIVHRALDLVIVVRDEGNAENQGVHRPWHLLRPALVAHDPTYAGDETAFCDAYRRGAHAPDLLSPWSEGSGFGSIRLEDQAA